MARVAPNLTNIGQRLRNVKKLFDLDLRFREMDEYGDYRQVISLPNPPIEDLAKGATGLQLARIGNDAMAEPVPESTPTASAGFVAAVSLTDVEGSLAEIRRAVHDLGACGIEVFTSIASRPAARRRGSSRRCSPRWPSATCRSGCIPAAPPQ